MVIPKIIVYLGYLILLVNVIAFFSKKKKNKEYKVFSIYLLTTFIIQVVGASLAENKIDNLFLSHYYFISQFVFLSIFYSIILNGKKIKIGVKFIFSLVLITLSINYILEPSIYYQFSLLEVTLCSIPIVIYSLVYFFQSLDSNNKKYLYIASGTFAYLLCSTLIFLSGNYVSPTKTFWYQFIWIMNVSLYAIYQSLIFIEWYKNFRKKEVVAEMIAKTRIDCIALFLGINADNKMTTVFLQKDIFKNLILYNKNHPIKSGEAFDFTQPCPDNCD